MSDDRRQPFKRSCRPPKPTLTHDYEFRRAYDKGKSIASGSVVTYAVKRKFGGVRIGITTGKRVGDAVHRNRARRVIREAFRQLKPFVSGNWELVFVARARTPSLKMQTVMRDMRGQLTRIGVIAPSGGQAKPSPAKPSADTPRDQSGKPE